MDEKIVSGSFEIQAETLTRLADVIRYYNDMLPWNIQISDIINSNSKPIVSFQVGGLQIMYREFVDYSGQYEEGIENWNERIIMAFSFSPHPLTGELVPTLYWTKDISHGPDLAEPLYFSGWYDDEGEELNKWQKFDEDSFPAFSDAPKMFIYTPRIIISRKEQSSGLKPSEMTQLAEELLSKYYY